jgi:hypothetical protein
MGSRLGHFLERDDMSEVVEETQMRFLELEVERSCIRFEKG